VGNFSPFWSRANTFSGPLPLIGFTDSTDPRILKAVQEIDDQKLARPVLIGNPQEIRDAYKKANLPLAKSDLILPPLNEADEIKCIDVLIQKQSKSSLSRDDAKRQLSDSLYEGIALLLLKKLDGLVGGSLRPTADIVKAALQCVGPKAGVRLISGHFLIESDKQKTWDNTPFLFADCAVVPEPSARALAGIAMGAAAAYRFFTKKEPKVAMLSFSTRDSAVHPLVDRIKEAVQLIKKQEPNLVVDGEIQVDAALSRDVAVVKHAEDSPITERANVFVFPTLEAGNIGYKMVQRFSNTRVAGPILWGLDRPMSDLSRGCTVEEVVDTTRCIVDMVREAA
jgi:phosphate acetyltransferase